MQVTDAGNAVSASKRLRAKVAIFICLNLRFTQEHVSGHVDLQGFSCHGKLSARFHAVGRTLSASMRVALTAWRVVQSLHLAHPCWSSCSSRAARRASHSRKA